MIRRPPRSTLFPTRRSSDLLVRRVLLTPEPAAPWIPGLNNKPGDDPESGAVAAADVPGRDPLHRQAPRSEEHTSELQSRQYLVCRLLLEKKKLYGTGVAVHD